VSTKDALLRLKRRLGRERARHDRWEQEARASGNIVHAERCFGEANVLSLAMGMVDDELRKLAKEKQT
jgi:hypothetical protein